MLNLTTPTILPGTLSINRALASPAFFSAEVTTDRNFANINELLLGIKLGLWVQATYTDGNVFPSSAFFEAVPNSPTSGVWYDTDWIGNVSAQPGKMQVMWTDLGGGTGTKISIRFYFLAQYDIQDVYKDIFYNNRDKFLKDSRNSSSILDNNANSSDVYSTPRYFRATLFIRDTADSDKLYKQPFSVANRLRFYERDVNNATPLLQTNLFQLDRGGVVTDLVTTAPTLVRIQVKDVSMPSGWDTGAQVFLFLIQTSDNDTNITRDQNYLTRYVEAVSLTTPLDANYGLSNGVWTFPNSGITNLGGGIYQVECTIDGSQLVNGKKYRIIHVWRSNNAGFPTEVYPAGMSVNEHDFSFISQEFLCTGPVVVPSLAGVTLTENSISDYLQTYGSYLRVTVAERLLSRIQLDTTAYDNDVNRVKTFLQAIRTIKVLFYSVNADDSNKLDVFTELNATKSVAWSADLGLSVTEPAGNAIRVEFGYRTRYEDNIPNIYTLNGTAIEPALSNMNWRRRDIRIRIDFTLKNKDANTNADLDDVYRLEQLIKVKDFDPPNTAGELTSELTDENGNEIPFACDGEGTWTACFTKQADAYSYKFLGGIEREPYGLVNLKEEESFDSPHLTTAGNDILSNVDENFVGNVACMDIDVSKLDYRKTYRVLGIKKRVTNLGHGGNF
jgi:hypothetical protein